MSFVAILDSMIKSGLITLEKVQVLRYGTRQSEENGK
jgi:PII-like signaling protein